MSNPKTTLCQSTPKPDLSEQEGLSFDLNKYVVKEWQQGRSIVALYQCEQYGWNGFRWVPIGSPVHLLTFDSEQAAHTYAQGLGLTPGHSLSDEQIRAIWREAATGIEGKDAVKVFLRCFGDAVIRAGAGDFSILRNAAIALIAKYQLESLAAGAPGLPNPGGKEESEVNQEGKEEHKE